MKEISIPVFILIDEDGDFAIHFDADELHAVYTGSSGDMDASKAYRLVKLTVNVPLPVAALATITVPPLPCDAKVKLDLPIVE